MNLKEKIEQTEKDIRNLSDKFNQNENTLGKIREEQNEILRTIERLSGKIDGFKELDVEENPPDKEVK